MKRVTHYAVVALIMLAVVSPALAQDTGAVTSAYERAFAALVAVLIAVLGIGGYTLVRDRRQGAEVVVGLLEFLAKLTATTADDDEVAKLRAELEKLKAALPPTVTGADVSRDEVEAEG